MPVFGQNFTVTEILWVFLSLTASICNCVGFYLPYWIRGTMFNSTEVSFGSFRRCNYPRLDEKGAVTIIYECGRYVSFYDIPSVSWQITTIVVGVGAAGSLLVALTSLASCWVRDAVTRNSIRATGAVQFLMVILIITGVTIYPNGWSTREIREACGNISDSYDPGTCHLSSSLYLLGTGVILLTLCIFISCWASRTKPHSCRI
ncbi:LHFPL tetraspan subfamily member 6 protein-like isoform X1 [Tachypleus tridentatus]|uniref:LHFPL tetraspan subfamily member 6 protein-like isoform X1 n=1 Tax=Tachypleus tridentatus TaxID=6853 RepID=UPI003FCF2776